MYDARALRTRLHACRLSAPTACTLTTLTTLTIAPAACSHRFQVPRPTSADERSTALPAAEPATVTLPISIALSTIRAQLDRKFPPSDSLDQAACAALYGIVCHQYVYHRDTLDFHMDGDRISLSTHIRYRARVALPRIGAIGSCGYGADPMKRARLRFAATLYWRVDWSLGSRATTLAATLLDPCRATVFDMDATPLMQHIVDAQLETLRQSVDSALPTVATIRLAADSIWRAVQMPMPLDSGIWLVMNPETVTLTPVTGMGQVATTAVTLVARPRVVLGERPQPAIHPLPTLSLAPATGRLHVPVDIEVPFTDIAQRATAQLTGQTAGDGMRVRDVKVWSAGDTSVVQVDLAGKVTGSLYLVGRVGYDIASRTLVVNDLRYTVQSSTTMSKLEVTLGAFLVKRAIESATNRGRWNVGELLDQTRSRLTAQLNRPLGPGMSLAGTIESVRLAELRTTPTAYLLRVVLDGEARVLMQ